MLIKLSREVKLPDGTTVTHMQADKDYVLELTRLNWGIPMKRWRKMKMRQKMSFVWPSVTAQTSVSKKTKKRHLDNCRVQVRQTAIEFMEPYRGKQTKFHHLIAELVGLIDDEVPIGNGDDEYQIDHKNENPADNRKGNLRAIRAPINSMRKGNAKSGIRPDKRRFRFNKPMIHFIRRNFEQDTIDEVPEDAAWVAEFEYMTEKVKKDDRTQSTREAAERRKSRLALNVIELLAMRDDVLEGWRIDDDGDVVHFSMESELNEQFTLGAPAAN